MVIFNKYHQIPVQGKFTERILQILDADTPKFHDITQFHDMPKFHSSVICNKLSSFECITNIKPVTTIDKYVN